MNGILSGDEYESMLIERHTSAVHNKIKKAKVGIAGLGGLGSNVAVALARLGVGYLKLVDFDVVEPSNLNRQHYFMHHLGSNKTDALSTQLRDIHPYINIETMNTFLTIDNVLDIFKDVDIVVEAFDNPNTKASIVDKLLTNSDKIIVAASGMAGYYSNNIIRTRKISDNFYLVGDFVNGIETNSSLMSSRVIIVAGHQSNTVLRIIMNEMEV